MPIRSEFDIQFQLAHSTAMVAMLHLHPSLERHVRMGNVLVVEHLEGRWWTMDARHNEARPGRVLMAAGRDAADVAMTTSFGNAELRHFYVESQEVLEDGTVVPPLAAEGAGGVRE